MGYLHYWIGYVQITLCLILVLHFLYQSGIIVERLVVFNRVRKNLVKTIIPSTQIGLSLVDIELTKEKILMTKNKQLFSLKKDLNMLLCIGITAPLVAILCLVIRIYQLFHWNFGCGSNSIEDIIIEFFNISIYQLGFGVLISMVSVAMYYHFKNRYDRIENQMSIVSSEFISLLLKRA